ncbi:hypothetical protein D3C81_888720 [compost metagenome]
MEIPQRHHRKELVRIKRQPVIRENVRVNVELVHDVLDQPHLVDVIPHGLDQFGREACTQRLTTHMSLAQQLDQFFTGVFRVHHRDDGNDQVEKFRLVCDGKHLIPQRIDEMDRTLDLGGLADDEVDLAQPEEDLLDVEPVQILNHHDIDVAALEAVDDLVDVLVQYRTMMSCLKLTALQRQAIDAEE